MGSIPMTFQRLFQSVVHPFMEFVLDLRVSMDIEVMLVGFQGVPSTLPGHVLDQLPQSALYFRFSGRTLINVSYRHSHVPMACLVNIDLDASSLAGWVPVTFAKRFWRDLRSSTGEKQG